MDCRQVESHLSPYLDGELDPGEAGSLRAHLDRCRSCRGRWEALAATREAFQHLAPEGVSPGFTVRLQQQLSQEPRWRGWLTLPWRGWLRWSPVGGLVVLALVTGLLLKPRVDGPDVPRPATPGHTVGSADSGQLEVSLEVFRQLGRAPTVDQLPCINCGLAELVNQTPCASPMDCG